MNPLKVFRVLEFLSIAIYFGISKYIFDTVHLTSPTIIDELFHLPQGVAYCEQNFTTWDNKITTLPGLYLVSSVVGFYLPCTTYNLRFINLLASTLNLILFASILKYVYGNSLGSLKIIVQAINLAILPPLYFFSHVYYTDTLSLTFLLAYWRLCLTNKYKLLIFLFGFCSIIMRQTNVIWIGMVLGHRILDLAIRSSRVFGNKMLSGSRSYDNTIISCEVDKSKLKRYYGLNDAVNSLIYHVKTCGTTFIKFLTVDECITISIHLLLLVLFCGFIWFNGSIVVGDKSAHKMTLHLPQLLYFLLFYGCFGLPHVFSKFRSTLNLLYQYKVTAIFIAVIMVVAVHFNSVIHPYLLADNRHYTFYIWNRWFLKYDFAKYATVPVYLFLLFSLCDNLRGQNCISFLLPYVICCFSAVAFQRMIEVRYFLVPFILLRLRFAKSSTRLVAAEFLLYAIINAAMFYVFFTKDVYWTDFSYAQKIIW